MNKRSLFLFVILPLLAGCAKLAHVTELLTLQDLSVDQDKQDLYIKKQNENFSRLLAAIRTNANSLVQLKNKRNIEKNFGKPLYSKTVVRDGQPREKWLYCYPTEVLKSDRVYIYFDKKGRILEWKYIGQRPY